MAERNRTTSAAQHCVARSGPWRASSGAESYKAIVLPLCKQLDRFVPCNACVRLSCLMPPSRPAPWLLAPRDDVQHTGRASRPSVVVAAGVLGSLHPWTQTQTQTQTGRRGRGRGRSSPTIKPRLGPTTQHQPSSPHLPSRPASQKVPASTVCSASSSVNLLITLAPAARTFPLAHHVLAR